MITMYYTTPNHPHRYDECGKDTVIITAPSLGRMKGQKHLPVGGEMHNGFELDLCHDVQQQQPSVEQFAPAF